MDMFRKKKKSGFTLVELLVVLVIIGIIVAIILPNTLKAINQAKRRETAGILRAVTNACFLCFSTTRSWSSCNTLGQLKLKSYIDSTIGAATPTYSLPLNNPITCNVGIGCQANYSKYFPNWPALN